MNKEDQSNFDDNAFSITFFYDSLIGRMERTIKRLFILLVLCIICLFASNALWLWYESTYETIAYEQDGDGLNNVNYGDQGDLTNVPTGED